MNDEEIRRCLDESLPEHREDFWDDVRRDLSNARGDEPAATLPSSRTSSTLLPGALHRDSGHRPAGSAGVVVEVARWRTWRVTAAAVAVAVAGAGAGITWQQVLSPMRSQNVSVAGAGEASSAPEGSPTPTTLPPTGSGASSAEAVSPSDRPGTTDATVPDDATTGARVGPSNTTPPPVNGVQAAGTSLGEVSNVAPSEAGAWLTACGIAMKGTPASAVSWLDRRGRNVLLVTRAPVGNDRREVTVRVYLAVRLGTTTRLVNTVSQQVDGAAARTHLPSVADVDRNGVGEATLGWLAPAAGQVVSPVAIVTVLTEGKEYVLRAALTPRTPAAGPSVPGVAAPTRANAPAVSSSSAGGGLPTVTVPGVPEATAALGSVAGGVVDSAKNGLGAASETASLTAAAAGEAGTNLASDVVLTLLSAVPAAPSWPQGVHDTAERAARALLA